MADEKKENQQTATNGRQHFFRIMASLSWASFLAYCWLLVLGWIKPHPMLGFIMFIIFLMMGVAFTVSLFK